MQIRQVISIIASALCIIAVFYSCGDAGTTDNDMDNRDTAAATTSRSSESPEKRGEYLTNLGGCNDCHSPKIINQQGLHVDTAKRFSGYQSSETLFTVHPDVLSGKFYQMSPGINAFAGPWGVSFAANLTPDSATGIGTWTADIFKRAIRSGKHMGVETGRPILPPMPWYEIAKATDEDLEAIYAYLRSIRPVNNRVPAPIPPNQVKTSR